MENRHGMQEMAWDNVGEMNGEKKRGEKAMGGEKEKGEGEEGGSVGS